MEVKIGIQHAPRELVFESAQTPQDVESAVDDAIARGTGALTLTDERGRKIIVSVPQLAYVEIAASSPRPVGFTVS